jgi:excisionase family DNA binding protein
MKLPKPIRERPSIAGNPDQDQPAGDRIKSATAGSTAPTNDQRRAMPERLLTVQEAGEMLNTGERFPRRLIAERRIRFVRVGRHVRIPESAIADYVAAQTVEAMRLPGVR